MTAVLRRSLLADYGEDVCTAAGARRWTRGSAIRSPAHYVGAVRRLARRRGVDLPYMLQDGRALAALWCVLSPTEALGEAGEAWASYLERALERPDRLGSDYNVPVEIVRRGWSAGVPARAVRLGCWRGGHVSRRRLARRVRAAGRTSLGGACRRTCQVTLGCLEQLGRMSPELQRAALHVSGYYHRDGGTSGCRDLDWIAIAAVHRRMVDDPHERARWSAGRALVVRVLDGAELVPGRPDLPVELALRLARGEAPAAVVRRRWTSIVLGRVAGAPLNDDDASAWLAQVSSLGGVHDPRIWLGLQGRAVVGEAVRRVDRW